MFGIKKVRVIELDEGIQWVVVGSTLYLNKLSAPINVRKRKKHGTIISPSSKDVGF